MKVKIVEMYPSPLVVAEFNADRYEDLEKHIKNTFGDREILQIVLVPSVYLNVSEYVVSDAPSEVDNLFFRGISQYVIYVKPSREEKS